MEPWGFEPQIQPCHGRVIPFHYGPGIGIRLAENCSYTLGSVKLFASGDGAGAGAG